MSESVKTLRVTCRACGGRGITATRGNNHELQVATVCHACAGQKELTVREIDPAFSVILEGVGPNKNGKRVILAVTWAGDLMCGTPLTREEKTVAAAINDVTGGLVSSI